MSVSVSARTFAALLFLALQLGMIVRARFDPGRYFVWAPHDAQTEYEIEVVIDGRALTPQQVVERYRLTWNGVNPRAAEHLLRLVGQYEETRGAADAARVVVHYRTNGREWREWRWPRP